MSSTPSPIAVSMARVFLLILGFSALAVAAALNFYGTDAPVWAWILLIGIGVLAIVSACFESSSGVVATAFAFFYPLS